ncbi:MAG: LacI family DNA-binding transcriptional regulator, partial [Candidatus Nanopelagicales bacterium]
MESVAALAGVSRATVSRVVNGRASVDPKLAERVKRAIDRLGYAPNQAARSLISQRSEAVAMVVFETDARIFGDPYFAAIIRGISQEAGKAGLAVVLLMAHSNADVDRILRYLRAAPVDGVLLISEHSNPCPISGTLDQTGVPVVLGGRPMDRNAQRLYADCDNVGGGRLAAEHLLAGGRKVIAT